MFKNTCDFDFQSKEEGLSKRLRGDLIRFEMKDTTQDPQFVTGIECFWEELDTFNYPHVALLLDLYCGGERLYMRIDRTQTRDSCYCGFDRQAVRNGNPFRKKSRDPEILESVVFREPVPFHVFRSQFLRQTDVDFMKIRRNCKWFALAMWEHVLASAEEQVYGSDDRRIINKLRNRDCENIRRFMKWTYWWGSWVIH